MVLVHMTSFLSSQDWWHVFVTVSIFVRTLSLSLSLSLDSLCVFELYAGGSSLLIASHGAQVLALRTDSIACKGVNGRTYETWKDSLTRGSRVGKILATWLAPNSCIFPCTAILGRSKDMYDHKLIKRTDTWHQQ